MNQSSRKTRLKETMIQTEEIQNSPRKSSIKSGRISHVSKSQFSASKIKYHQLYISNAAQPSTETGDNYEIGSSIQNYEDVNSKLTTPLSRNVKVHVTGNENQISIRDSRTKSIENLGRISQLRKSTNNASGNMFDGIERIDFNDPSNPKNFTTGRSKNIVIKGFHNTYFQNYKDITSSPNPEEENVFDEDDDNDEEFPFDDFQSSMQKKEY